MQHTLSVRKPHQLLKFQKVLIFRIERYVFFAGLVSMFSVLLCEFLDYLMTLHRPQGFCVAVVT